jgi:hypothetical protein
MMTPIAKSAFYIAGVVLLTASACQMVPPPVNLPTACGAADLQGLVGQPASVLQTMKFGVQTRIIRPGDMVTEDYSESRLNIEIDANEKISRVYCG